MLIECHDPVFILLCGRRSNNERIILFDAWIEFPCLCDNVSFCNLFLFCWVCFHIEKPNVQRGNHMNMMNIPTGSRSNENNCFSPEIENKRLHQINEITRLAVEKHPTETKLHASSVISVIAGIMCRCFECPLNTELWLNNNNIIWSMILYTFITVCSSDRAACIWYPWIFSILICRGYRRFLIVFRWMTCDGLMHLRLSALCDWLRYQHSHSQCQPLQNTSYITNSC